MDNQVLGGLSPLVIPGSLESATRLATQLLIAGEYMAYLYGKGKDLSSEIKNLMFTFEDLISLDDRSIQKLLKEVDNKDLTMALKACSNELGNKLLSNISSRAAEMIREELEYMPPVRLREVEEVQQRIIEVVRRMEEEGQLTLGDSGGSDMMV